MKLIKKSHEKRFYIIFCIEILAFILLLSYIVYNLISKNYVMVMGGFLHKQELCTEIATTTNDGPDMKKFFRPSCSNILNDTDLDFSFFDKYTNKNPSEITIDKNLLKTPEETLINYYRILKSASYYDENSNKYAGCGTIGSAYAPYPIAYNFLAESYKKNLNFKDYLDSFKNIHHINLMKLKEIPLPIKHDYSIKRYFVELETIEGSDKPMTNFGYYYGFIDLSKENNSYKISNMDFYGEDFLCAPYHGWRWFGESVVEIKYGDWCKLIDGKPTTEIDGYTKKISFKGTDGNEYMIEFLTLTNNTDVEVAQYKKDSNGNYKRILLEPEKCLDNNTSL